MASILVGHGVSKAQVINWVNSGIGVTGWWRLAIEGNPMTHTN
jgi:hypothetical protein